jgi:predicted PurR-regulated permease PerM
MHIDNQENRRREFLWRVSMTFVIAAVFLGTVLLLWKVHQVLLVLFAGILAAIFLRTCASAVSNWTKLSKRWSLAIVIVTILLVLTAISFFLAPAIAEEVDQLKQRLPAAFNHAMDWVREQPWGKALIEGSQPDNKTVPMPATGAMTQVSKVFSNTFEALAGFIIVIFIGIYMAANPMAYVGLLLKGTPREGQFALKRTLVRSGATLRSWLLGQLVCMIVIGVGTWVGLHFLKVPLAGALGFLAGLFEFVPTVGPILSAVPAILLSFVESPMKALYVVILFIVLQFIENHTLVPLVQAKAIDLPPVVLILSLLLFSTLFGFLGLFLATPMTAVIAVILEEFIRRRKLAREAPSRA